jgi:glucosamine-6-phosphate deaminase
VRVVVLSAAAAAAEQTAALVADALRSNPRLVLGLATGRTMEAVYGRLARIHRDEGLDFSACRTFNLDEFVGLPTSDRHSFRHYTERHLFTKVNIRRQNAHSPNGSAPDLDAECAGYEWLIARSGGIDLQLLGLGLNGHIAFNEPPSKLRSRTHVQTLSPETRARHATQFPRPDRVPRLAITMGVGTILDCRRCLVLVTGLEKAAIAAKAIEGSLTNAVPASALQLHPDCTMILDPPAASKLKASWKCSPAKDNKREA